jgi:hypothetical protein
MLIRGNAWPENRAGIASAGMALKKTPYRARPDVTLVNSA